MSDIHAASRSVGFWKKGATGTPYLIVHVSDAPDSPVRLVRPRPDGSGDDVLVTMSREHWSEMVGFIGPLVGEGE